MQIEVEINNDFIDNNVNDIFINNNYKKWVTNNEITYKKSYWDTEEFNLKIKNNKYSCSVPLKNGLQYVTSFDCANYANHFILKHLDYMLNE